MDLLKDKVQSITKNYIQKEDICFFGTYPPMAKSITIKLLLVFLDIKS